MGKSLVIVESPAKAKTINKYLGKDFVVKSSVGHIRDLPTSGSRRETVDPKARSAQAAMTRKMSPRIRLLRDMPRSDNYRRPPSLGRGSVALPEIVVLVCYAKDG